MLITTAAAQAWLGRPAMDPYGEPVGTVAEIRSDSTTGVPEWLALSGAADGTAHIVPIAGAVESGRQIRVVPTAEQIRVAPLVELGADTDVEAERVAAEHYGLHLDKAFSSTGLLRASEPVTATIPGEPRSSTRRKELIDGLRAAHAMEQASLRLLAAMRWRDRDEELVHDLALHHKATNDHAEAVRVRLDELEASRARPLDWLAKATAYFEAQRGRLRSAPDAFDIAEAYAFERREVDAYGALADRATALGDERTAALCETIRADEVAMAITLRNHRLHADPGARRGEQSPFAAPAELVEAAPRS
jgi:ferritin-like metal-binding protein YciE